MTTQSVNSGWVKSIGYDPKTKTLHVITKKGDTYQYSGVPQKTYDELAAAESTGQHLNSIKANFKYRKVR